MDALHRSHVYFLPSFRESTPVTLLESYLAGCYPIVADTSAQGEIVRRAGGRAVPVESPAQVVRDLADAVILSDTRKGELFGLMDGARKEIGSYFDSRNYDREIARAYASGGTGGNL